MKKHYVYFYGSTKITSGNRNQIIGFDGIDKNPELIAFGEKCLKAGNNQDGFYGETGTLFPKESITIVPFRYGWCTGNHELQIIKHLEDVILANELYVKSESIGFPLMMLRSATQSGYNLLGKGSDLPSTRNEEIKFSNEWCCFGHYYLFLIKKALSNKGYSATGVRAGGKAGNLINTSFRKLDGTRLEVHADAGM